MPTHVTESTGATVTATWNITTGTIALGAAGTLSVASGGDISIASGGVIAIADGGNITNANVEVTAISYTITKNHERVFASGGTITLPAASAMYEEFVFNTSTNDVTVAAAGTDLIDGYTNFIMTSRYEAYALYSDGVSNWTKIGG